jgi:hypothetical protein
MDYISAVRREHAALKKMARFTTNTVTNLIPEVYPAINPALHAELVKTNLRVAEIVKATHETRR